jgi:hypothetical protein
VAYCKVIKKIKGMESQMVVKGMETCIDQVGSGGNFGILDVFVLDSKGYSGKSKENLFFLSLEGK